VAGKFCVLAATRSGAAIMQPNQCNPPFPSRFQKKAKRPRHRNGGYRRSGGTTAYVWRALLRPTTPTFINPVPQQGERGERSIFLFLVFCYFRVQEAKIAKGIIFEDTYKKKMNNLNGVLDWIRMACWKKMSNLIGVLDTKIVYGVLLHSSDTLLIILRKACIAVAFVCSFPILLAAIYLSFECWRSPSISTVVHTLASYAIAFTGIAGWAVCRYTKQAGDTLMNVYLSVFVAAVFAVTLFSSCVPACMYQHVYILLGVVASLLGTSWKEVHISLCVMGSLRIYTELDFYDEPKGAPEDMSLLERLLSYVVAVVCWVLTVTLYEHSCRGRIKRGTARRRLRHL